MSPSAGKVLAFRTSIAPLACRLQLCPNGLSSRYYTRDMIAVDDVILPTANALRTSSPVGLTERSGTDDINKLCSEIYCNDDIYELRLRTLHAMKTFMGYGSALYVQ